METPEEFVNRLGKFPVPVRELDELNRLAKEKLDAASLIAQERGWGVRVITYVSDNLIMIEATSEVPAGEIQYFDNYGPFKDRG